jgi:hypothetical protein
LVFHCMERTEMNRDEVFSNKVLKWIQDILLGILSRRGLKYFKFGSKTRNVCCILVCKGHDRNYVADQAMNIYYLFMTHSMTLPVHIMSSPLWRHTVTQGGGWRGKLVNGVGSQYSSNYLGTRCIQQYYSWCAHLGCQ